MMDWSLMELVRQLACGKVSSREVTAAYMAKEDVVHGYITRCEEALSWAEEADRRRAAGEVHPLCGVPIAVKDNICTSGVKTTCGSRMLADFVPPYDATAWNRLRQAGCVLLGKTNMDEFGMGSSTENSAFHPTKNPWCASCVPGGSSGGSAACVAAGLAPAALGSDTGGSIRQPGAFCGVVGMRPTYGAVSRYGLVAFASTLDCIGPMTRTVEDNALLLDALVGADPMDATCINRHFGSMSAQMNEGVKGLRIGLMMASASPEVFAGVMQAAKALEQLGARVEEITLPHAEQALPAYYVLSSAEASSNLARFDGVRYGHRAAKYADLEELYVRSRNQGFGPEVKRRILLGTYVLSAGHYEAYYRQAQAVRQLVKQDYSEAFARCHVLLSPVTPTAAWQLGGKAAPTDVYQGDVYTVPASMAGLPAMTLPAGKTEDGLPLAVQLTAPALQEPLLYRVGRALEVELYG